jgi:diguanylate cyclase (GGDEF)-like protein
MAMLVALGAFGAASLRHLRRQRRNQAGTSSRLVLVDSLTGLPNRSAFEMRLARAAQACSTERGELALLVVNLDGFKPVNSSFGHAVGDQLLKQAGQRIMRLLRSGDYLARISGDEFVLLLTEDTARDKLDRLCNSVIESIAKPFGIGTREVTLTCSIGAALYPQHGEADKLLARTDFAMQAAKRAGGAQVAFYSAEMDADLTQDFDLLRELRQALENDSLELAFQPKIDAGSGKITAAEALLRWRHPTRGEISPTVFVGVAERFGLVNRLGDWVIDRACRQAQRWAERGLNMRVAINLSAQHLRQPDLVQRIQAALRRHNVDPARLTCEITETLAMENTQATQAMLTQLGTLGVHLSIDDFGTGYSSLAYLRSLPAREIKIDRSFVKDLERSADARAVVDAVVKLAHALGKRVVAEGVETIRQRRILTELRCDELQGYLFARPMSPDDLLEWALDARNRDEEAFRSSLYVSPGEGDPRLRPGIAAAKQQALH